MAYCVPRQPATLVCSFALFAASAALSVSSSALAAGDVGSPGAPGEVAFIAENNAAMATMMRGMMIPPTGDADRDFAVMMIAHHQGAIDMAQAELRHGRNEQLRRIAQEIVVDQTQEIAAMQIAIGHPPPPSRAVPTQAAPGTPSP
jgi:uncharacterized protein (DUF305 family)